MKCDMFICYLFFALSFIAHYDIASKMNIIQKHTKQMKKMIMNEIQSRRGHTKNKGRKNKSGNVLRQSWFVFTIHNTTVNCSTGYE